MGHVLDGSSFLSAIKVQGVPFSLLTKDHHRELFLINILIKDTARSHEHTKAWFW